MVKFVKVQEDITHLKPCMKAVKDINDLPSPAGYRNVTLQVKADGEFNYIKWQREGDFYCLNRFGRKTTGLPAMADLDRLLRRWNIVEVELLAEMYATENGLPVPLPTFIHYLKGGDRRLHEKIKLGLFELLSVNGQKCNLIYPRKFEQMKGWVEGGEKVSVLEFIEVHEPGQIKSFWESKVAGENWEGLIYRLNGDTWKVKPRCDLDAVVIGINKNNKGFELQKAKSLRMALMNEDGTFVEIGDCGGIGEDESKELWNLMNLKIGEDRNTVFVQPVLIATIEYERTYQGTKNLRYKIDKHQISEFGQQTLVKLKSPHIMRYRQDKRVCVEDIGAYQVSEC